MSGVISGVIASIGGSAVAAPVISGPTGSWSYIYGQTAQSSGIADRSLYGYIDFYMDNDFTNGGGPSIGFTVSGTGLTYEWQYLSNYAFNQPNSGCSPQTAALYSNFMYRYNSFYYDSFSGSASAALTFNSVYGYYPNISGSRGVDGYWRLKVSKAGGTVYSRWGIVAKRWNVYYYDCNCSCPSNDFTCGCQCDCDENSENCTGCCYQCCGGETCTDTCSDYSNYSVGGNGNWCA